MTIDWWTLGLQTVNVVTLIWLLGRFFWRPVAGIIDQRRIAAQQALAAAEGGDLARHDVTGLHGTLLVAGFNVIALGGPCLDAGQKSLDAGEASHR